MTEAEIRRTQQNKLFVKPSFYTSLKSIVEQHSILMLKGRQGSGKTTLALNLAAEYLHLGYECLLYNSSNIEKFSRKKLYSNERYFIMIDNIWTSVRKTDILSKCQNQVSKIQECRYDVKFLFTDSKFDHSSLMTEKLTEFAILFDLDKTGVYSREDKEYILSSYLSKNKIKIVDRQPEYKEEVCREINSTTVPDIVSVESLLGFPGTCATFCANTDHIRLGVEYFTKPPLCVVEVVCKLMKRGQSNIENAYQYCLLVYLLLAGKNDVDFKALDLNAFKDIYSSVFGYEIQIVQKFINDAMESLSVTYLNVNENTKICFRHSGITQAVLISFGRIKPEKVIQQCRLDHILQVIRPCNYKPLHGEAVLFIDNESTDLFKRLGSRLFEELLKGESEAQTVGRHLAKYITICGDVDLSRDVVDKLGKYKIKNIKQCRLFFKLFLESVALPDTFVIQIAEVNDLSLCWMYICLKSTNNVRLSDHILTDVIEHNMDLTFLALMVDESRNTLLHYFIVWNSECERKILTALKGSKLSFHVQEKNSNGHTPLHFAAYLGRSEIFDILVNLIRSNQSKANTVLSKMFAYDYMQLVTLAEKGHKQRQTMLKPDDKIISINDTFRTVLLKFGNDLQFTEILDIIKIHGKM